MKFVNVFLSLFFLVAISVAASAQCSPAQVEACKAKTTTVCAKMAMAATATTPAASCQKAAATEASATKVATSKAIEPKENGTAKSCCEPCPMACCAKEKAVTSTVKVEAVEKAKPSTRTSL